MKGRVWALGVLCVGVIQGLAFGLVASERNDWDIQPWPFLRAVNAPLGEASAWLSDRTFVAVYGTDIAALFILIATAWGAIHALRTTGAENWDMHLQPELMPHTFLPHAARGGCMQAFALIGVIALIPVVVFADLVMINHLGEASTGHLMIVLIPAVASQMFFAPRVFAGTASVLVGLALWNLAAL